MITLQEHCNHSQETLRTKVQILVTEIQ